MGIKTSEFGGYFEFVENVVKNSCVKSYQQKSGKTLFFNKILILCAKVLSLTFWVHIFYKCVLESHFTSLAKSQNRCTIMAILEEMYLTSIFFQLIRMLMFEKRPCWCRFGMIFSRAEVDRK
jgi:hypothetical protein